ncbi:hypothetical protein FVR03_21390 [Pontibacter qinzhouensis]|uniref:Uncharacterized protein n=1 Tax=Pontibacter qinzhouensis TaxID=2603253 RepID=A0A5C8IZW0_9BACT|nr:hypothetical protein [Pontibacter qinzhouensis]TXK26984.1 hypothetical protein FVR03_21390 [Pontibacter qinzhouensis]
MNRNNWHDSERASRQNRNREDDYRDSNWRNSERQQDQDSYRGAYRLDTSSDHRNQSTWNGFSNDNADRWSDQRDRQEEQRYRQNPDRHRSDFNNDFNQSHHSQPDNWQRNDRFNRSEDRPFTSRQNNYGAASNFNNDYGPDNYQHRQNENYGNMAGSLSFGYDGDRNSDPDTHRFYDPLSGRLNENFSRQIEQRSGRRNSADNNYNNRP